jgi:tRNA G18 (ribose-2'-O)-methylase SpoU
MYVLLDGVRSKFNVGAIFRTAEAFACTQILLTGITPQLPDKDIEKTSLGSEKVLPWQYWQYSLEAVQYLQKKGVLIIAAELDVNSVSLQELHSVIHNKQISYNKKDMPYCIVMGNEIDGVSKDILEVADIIVKIPMLGKIKESLNVGIAFGIITSWLRFAGGKK